jgi:Acetyltransferase (GNAT) domain
MTTKWHFVNARENFENYRDNWQQLGETVLGCNHPLANFDYVAPLLKCFGGDKVVLALKGVSGEDGMVLLQNKYPGVWESFTPNTGPFTFGLIKNTNGAADASVKSLVKAIPGYAVLLGFNKLDPANLVVDVEASQNCTDRVDYFETLQIPTDRPFDEYWSERSKNLRGNVSKKLNRLKNENTEYELREITAPEEVRDGVKKYGDIESRGWKGEAGTAVDIDNTSGAFYTEMLGRFAAKSKAVIYQLWFGDKVVASAFAVKGGGMIIILKITFDEDMKDYSPGLLMMYEIHKKAFDMQDVNFIEYYGKATQRAKQWAVTLRTLYHLNYYRNSLACNLFRTIRLLKNKVG